MNNQRAALSAARPETVTSTGKLAGFVDPRTKQNCFFGIPYAEPPIGSLRFKPTVPKKPWQGTLDATRFGAAGPQVFDPTEGDYEEFTGDKPENQKNPWVGSEDNLTLNIWTPDMQGKRPVVVWIHGGANWLESSRLETYHGDSIVARGDVVFVSLNYRLGVFGFLDVSVLGGAAYAGSHSNGLRDQLTALRWIKENISAFGGDPANITLMGESAGSIDLSWLLTNGQLDGIARRVVLMSGVVGLIGLSGDMNRGFTEEYGQELARDFLSRMGIKTMEELQSLSTDQIMEKVTKVTRSTDMLFYMDSIFWPRVSPGFTPVDPFRAARKGGGSNGIDVIIGCTGYEMGLWLTWDETLDRHPPAWSAEKLQHLTPVLQQEAIRLYGEVFAKDQPGMHGMHMIGDAIFVMPSIWLADELSRHGVKVWLYEFDWETDERRRALHAADQTFLFDKHGTQAGHHLLGHPKDETDRMARAALTHAMQDSLAAFARHGDPDRHRNPVLPSWPRYNEKDRAAMILDLKNSIKYDHAGKRREWWTDRVYEPALKKE